jgi:flavorubredoxin
MRLKEKAMRKNLKIILTVLAVFIIAMASGIAIVIGDVAGNMATDTHQLPNGAATGKALIIYDPGLSGGAKDVATKIGYLLQDSGYDVLLAGVKSQAANNLTGYNVIVVGGPVYAGKPASTIQTYLNSFNPPEQAKVGIFGYGSVKIDNSNRVAVMQDVATLTSSSNFAVMTAMKIVSSENINDQCNEFVTNLLE